MRRIYLFLIAFFTLSASANDINCQGRVTHVMDYPAKCSGGYSFKTSSSNGKWICAPSENANAIILTAYVAEKPLKVYMYDHDGTYTCSTLAHYLPARYVFVDESPLN